MIFFEVELSGGGVYNGPISGVRLPICDSETEFNQIREYVGSQDSKGKIIAISEIFFQKRLSCLCSWYDYRPYKTKDNVLLNSYTAGAAVLESLNFLPGQKYAPEITNYQDVTVKFKNGTTSSLRSLGYGGSQSTPFYPLVYISRDFSEGKRCTLLQSRIAYPGQMDPYINMVDWPSRILWVQDGTRPENLSSSEIANWNTVIQHETPSEVDTDPYNPGGGNTEPGGGDGNPDDTNVPIDFPTLPNVGGGEGVADSGLISIFNPTLTQIRNLAAFMWNSSLFDLSVWQKLYADPMNAIITLSIVPIDVPSVVSKVLKVGNISTGLSMNVASKQFIEFDCGSISIEEFWAAYLDYEPYTKFEIFLPYIGYKEISANDIMTKIISLKYHIDILSGACVAYLKCGDSILYSWNGHCSMQIPLSGTDMSQMVTGILGIVGGAATTIGGAMSGNFAVAASGAEKMASNAINNLKPTIEKSGSIGAASGILGIQTPYIIITRPRQALPLKQNQYTGYPSFMTVSLGSLSGFTIIEEIHLQNVPATTNELAEIEELLKQGVII
ncbi:MAG: hypothetical protein IJH65_07325 [Methanobrevibacter sp.]|nr:hypothetical protein [Methanobrevibacter sp.]